MVVDQYNASNQIGSDTDAGMACSSPGNEDDDNAAKMRCTSITELVQATEFPHVWVPPNPILSLSFCQHVVATPPVREWSQQPGDHATSRLAVI